MKPPGWEGGGYSCQARSREDDSLIERELIKFSDYCGINSPQNVKGGREGGKAQAQEGGGNAAEYPKQIRTSCTGIYHTVYHLTIKGGGFKREWGLITFFP